MERVIKLSEKGHTLIELAVASALIVFPIWLLIQSTISNLGMLKNIRFKYSGSEIVDEVRSLPMPLISQYLLDRAQASAPLTCQVTTFFSALNNVNVQNKMRLSLLDKQEAADYSGIDRIDPEDASYSEAFQRCVGAETVYETELADPITLLPKTVKDLNSKAGVYFCGMLSKKTGEVPSIMVENHPALIEYLFVPMDAASGTPLSCDDLSAGLPPAAIGTIYYTIYARRDDRQGKRVSRTISGQYTVGQL